ncbi:MAG: alanyl-tRNA synthetase [Acidobacteria bacterium]|nr:alanyl-tRNA synthetase [Acidobacteriota bacterium]
MHTENDPKKSAFHRLVKRFGMAGFLFFLIKGLLWLIVPSALIWLGYSL